MSRRQVNKRIKELVPDFAAYFAAKRGEEDTAWGALSLVMCGLGFTSDRYVRHSISCAREYEDAEGLRLAYMLLEISPSQRTYLGKLAEAFAEQHL